MIDGFEMQSSTASTPGPSDHRSPVDSDPDASIVADVAAVPERPDSPPPGPSHDRIAQHPDPGASVTSDAEMSHRLTEEVTSAD